MNRRLLLQRATATFGAATLGIARAATQSTSSLASAISEIRIGQSAVMSGPSAMLGREMQAGIEACFKRVNDTGGIGGRQLSLRSLDDGYEPDRCAANTAKLITSEGALALLGYVGTPTCNAAMPVFSASKVPFIGAFTGASSLRTPFNRQIFNIRASYLDEGLPIVNQLITSGASKIGIFHQADAYGKAVRESIELALKANGLRPVAVATIERNLEGKDLLSAVQKAAAELAASGATGIALGSVYAASAEFVKAIRTQRQDMRFVSVSFIGTSGLLERFGDQAKGIGIAQVVPSPTSGAKAIARDYQEAMRAAGTPQFTYGSMEGYIGAKVLVEGLRRVSGVITREKLIAALESFGRHDLGGFAVSFGPENHNGSKFVEMTVIGPGKTVIG